MCYSAQIERDYGRYLRVVGPEKALNKEDFAITDEPPAEVAAAGHDCCIIPIEESHIDAWLNPDPQYLGEMQAILENRARPVYEYRMAA